MISAAAQNAAARRGAFRRASILTSHDASRDDDRARAAGRRAGKRPPMGRVSREEESPVDIAIFADGRCWL